MEAVVNAFIDAPFSPLQILEVETVSSFSSFNPLRFVSSKKVNKRQPSSISVVIIPREIPSKPSLPSIPLQILNVLNMGSSSSIPSLFKSLNKVMFSHSPSVSEKTPIEIPSSGTQELKVNSNIAIGRINFLIGCFLASYNRYRFLKD